MTSDTFKQTILPLQSHMQLLAERMLGSEAEAEDVVQEVFLKFWKSRDKLDKVLNIRSYTMQTTRLMCIDILRERQRSNLCDTAIPDIPDQSIFDDVELSEHRSAMLHSMLDNLPEKQRAIVKMRYFEEKEISEIEHSLNISPGSIYTSLSRALQTLREKLKQC